MRYDCIGAHGNKAMHTPNLDYLVNRGISFDRCYNQNPLCMPSRCSFMSGLYPQQTGVTENGHEMPDGIDSTVANVFGRGGYRTVQIGKLHFQNHADSDLDPRAKKSYGFEVFQLSEEPGCYEDAYRTWLRSAYPDLVDAYTIPRAMSFERHGEREKFKVIDGPWEASHSGWVANQFKNDFHSWGTWDRPGFYHLGFYAPHPPLNPTKEMFEPYRDAPLPPLHRDPEDPRDPHDLPQETLVEYQRHFYALVTGVDLALGKVLDTLREEGSLDNTLIIFGSDHGDACGDHGRTSKGPSYLESITRMPWVMHWPAGFGTQGRRVEGLVEMVDMMPTLAELCGIPRHPAFQGLSYASELLEGREIAGREDVYSVHDPGKFMVRTRDYKLITYCGKDGSVEEELLFDLRSDPHEMRNRADSRDYKDILEQLRRRTFERTVHATTTILPRPHRF